jgi:hypothetical protein
MNKVFVFVVLGVELRALCLHPTTRTTPPSMWVLRDEEVSAIPLYLKVGFVSVFFMVCL